MSTEMGVWIDHRKAVIAIIAGHHEKTRQVDSNMEKHVRYSGAAQEDSALISCPCNGCGPSRSRRWRTSSSASAEREEHLG